ncbi:MAG TPA: AraC family transcriptional regulator [Luteitalea sp.]|nr:AraC family transcriptional regulator [Luteitalea sp.]
MSSTFPSRSSDRLDPLSDVISLLRPRTVFAKGITGAGRWGVSYSTFGHPSFCAVLDGRCRLTVEGHAPLTLEADDFLLLPATPAFTMTGFEPVSTTRQVPRAVAMQGAVRHGRRAGPAEVSILGGWCVFDAANSALLVSLLPGVIHVRGVERLSTLVRLLATEAAEQRPGRDLMLTRLVEALLIEALRAAPDPSAPGGLLRGLADVRLAPALRHMHQCIDRRMTVADLARTAGLSRSAFFDRFSRTVGIAPMDYLQRWRLAVAKDLLQRDGLSVSEVAARVGYDVVTSFSAAFSREVGIPPRQFAIRARASTGETAAGTRRRQVRTARGRL